MPPPPKPMFCAPTVPLLDTAASNSRVAPAEIAAVPVPDTAALKSNVPEETAISPLFVTFGAMRLVPVPPVFLSIPELVSDDDAELPRLIALSSRMFQVPAEPMMALATLPDASPTVAEPPLSESEPLTSKTVVPATVRPESVLVPLALSWPLTLVVVPTNESVPVSVSVWPPRFSVVPEPALNVPA